MLCSRNNGVVFNTAELRFSPTGIQQPKDTGLQVRDREVDKAFPMEFVSRLKLG